MKRLLKDDSHTIRGDEQPRCLIKAVAAAVLLAAVTGCTSMRSYYPIVSHPAIPAPELAPNPAKPSVALTWEFQTNGNPINGITRRHASRVVKTLEQSGAFSRVNNAGTPSDLTLTLTMNNVVESFVGAYTQGFLSGLTLGLIGTKVTDHYKCTATLGRTNGTGTQKEYAYDIVSTSGLIVSGVADVAPQKNPDAAFNTVLDQFILKSLEDFSRNGSLDK